MSIPPSEERVFISYATKDFQFVERLRGDLRNSNIPYWIDREGLQAGTPNWEKAIRSAITKAPAVIYVVSPNSFDSLFVRDEISIAQMYDRPIYPVWAFGDTWMKCVPMGLGQVQYADARGEHYEQGVSKLLQALRGVFPDLAITPKIVKPPAEGVERRNPYKGLKAFKEEDARDFFGRTAMIAALRGKFETRAVAERERLLAVIGASGSGKSSVVMAGVLPALKRGDGHGSGDWTYIPTLTPGNAPLRALTKALYHQFPSKTMASIDDELWHPSGMGLTRLADLIGERVVLFIDQFEELFMPNIAEDHRQQFINLLVSAVNEPHGSLSVLLTMRADFYDRPMNYRELGELFNNHHYSVLPMSLAELREAVEYPASLPDVGLDFEPGLVGEIVFDLRDQKDKGVLAGALPLLQFTLQQLYDLRDTSRPVHQLTYEAYRSMSGVSGAIGSHAEAEYHRLDADAQDKLGYVFLQLVNVDERGEATRKRAPLNLFAEGTPERRFVDALVKARLLQTDRDEEGATLEVAHEALLRTWKRLVEWIAATAEDIRLLQKVSAAAMEWAERDRPERLLWKHEELEDVYRMLERLAPPMDDVLQEFVRPEVERLVASFKGAPSYRQLVLVDRLGEIGVSATSALIRALAYIDDDDVESAVGALLWAYGDTYIECSICELGSDSLESQLGAVRALSIVPHRAAIPAVARLIESESLEIRRALVDALDELKDARAVELLSLAIKDPQRAVRQSAITALGRLGDARGFEALCLALEDGDAAVRSAAINALGMLGDKRAVETLLALLKDDTAVVRGEAVEALGELADGSAVTPLLNTLKDGDRVVNSKVSVVIRNFKDAQAVESLLLALSDTNHEVRIIAADALGVRKEARALVPMIQALMDSDSEVRRAAAGALGGLKDIRAVEPLLSLVKDTEATVRSAAAYSLGELGDQRAVEALLGLLADTDSFVRVSAARGLGKLNDERAVKPLLSLVKDSDLTVREAATVALGALKDERGVESLLFALNDSKWSVRRSAARALGEVGNQRALEPLIRALNDSDNDVRASAATALGKLGHERAITSLLHALSDSYDNVRSAATDALSVLMKDRALSPLLEALTGTENLIRVGVIRVFGVLKQEAIIESILPALNDPNSDVRSAAVNALGELEDERGLAPLLLALADTNPYVRMQSADALGMLHCIQAVEALLPLLNDMDIGVCASAAGALARLRTSSEANIPLAQLFIRYEYHVRDRVREALIELKRPEDVREIVPLLDHPFVAVQQTVIEILEGMQIPEATAALEEWRSKQPLT